jgi:hypothetical protein
MDDLGERTGLVGAAVEFMQDAPELELGDGASARPGVSTIGVLLRDWLVAAL